VAAEAEAAVVHRPRRGSGEEAAARSCAGRMVARYGGRGTGLG
jgi:hypothetical protein